MGKPLKLDARFCLNPVGQGLFYDGKVESFRFVYDCGSESERKFRDKAIDEFTKEVGGEKLPLLVMSHFHEDHVSGVERLLESVKFQYVLIPYLLPFERLALAICNSDQDAWYYEFLRSPFAYLSKRNEGGKVVVIGGKNPDKPRGKKGPDEGEPKEGRDEELTIDDDSFDMPNDVETEDLIGRFDRDWLGANLLVKNHSGYLRIKRAWRFRFFNFKVSEDRLVSDNKLQALGDCVKDVIGVRPDEAVSSDRVKDAITDADIRNRLRGCYERLFGDERLNVTSLIAFHGPTGSNVFHRRIESISIPFPRLFPMLPLRNIGYFLTDDVELQYRWNDIRQHFDREFPRMSGVMLPHHGSNKNGADKLIPEIKKHSVFYISAGIGNRYKDPHPDVVEEVSSNEQYLVWSNQFSKVTEQCSRA